MSITIKLSAEADRERIRRLAELDSKPAPHGDVLVAEVNGRLVAAMGMDGEPLLNVVRHRGERGWRCPPGEFQGYLDAVASAATFLDQLQLGDQR